MIQCKDCQYCEIGPEGQKIFKCDPFVNIVEPECLAKWQLLRLDMLAAIFHNMQSQQQKMAPMQDKIMKYVQRELNDLDEADHWKFDEENDENPEI